MNLKFKIQKKITQGEFIHTAILASKAGDGIIGILPPVLPNLLSKEFCTDSERQK